MPMFRVRAEYCLPKCYEVSIVEAANEEEALRILRHDEGGNAAGAIKSQTCEYDSCQDVDYEDAEVTEMEDGK